MAKTIEGSYVGSGQRIGIVVSRFNAFITEQLLIGAQDALVRHGVDEGAITVARCPGSFEVPLVAKRMAESGNYDGVIVLGAVIRGATSHYDLVAAEVTKGAAQVSLSSGVPVSFGVITTDTIEQAIERAGTKAGNKGADAAVGVIEMINLLASL